MWRGSVRSSNCWRRFDRQGGVPVHDLYRTWQAGPVHRTAQDVVTVDHRLQRIEEGVHQAARIECHDGSHEICVAFGFEQMVKEDAFLQRCQRIDVLDIGGALGDQRDDLVDLVLCEVH